MNQRAQFGAHDSSYKTLVCDVHDSPSRRIYLAITAVLHCYVSVTWSGGAKKYIRSTSYSPRYIHFVYCICNVLATHGVALLENSTAVHTATVTNRVVLVGAQRHSFVVEDHVEATPVVLLSM